MGEFDALAEAIYKDKVRRARAMSPEEKLLAGQELFDFACKFTLAGIAVQHPEADEDERFRLLRQRLALGEKLDRLSVRPVPDVTE
ncbi:MAG TPA: hypothetical protein VIT91_05905 [Chthoniobacterales bacterium]